MSDSTEPRSPLADGLLAVLFGALVAAPLVVQATGAVGSEDAFERERRSASPPPELPTNLDEWAAFPRETEAWYQDGFGLRTPLLYAHQWLHLYGYGISPTSNLHVGRDRWLWASGEGVLEAHRGARPFEAGELDAWRESFVLRERWLRSLAIDYALVIVPLPALLAAKDRDSEFDHLFYPLGPHWTDRGALVTLRYLMERLPERHRRHAVPGPEDVYPRSIPVGEGDDLSRGFLVEDYFEQGELALGFLGGSRARELRPRDLSPSDHGMITWKHRGDGRSGLTNVLFLRDSFGRWILPQLAQQFART